MTEFLAIDGEAFTTADEHKYVLLACSTGKYAFKEAGLSTANCFEFLLALPKEPVKVAFGLNYDVNMMLRDVDLENLIKLWREGECRWKGYTIQWIPGKIFQVKSNRRSVKVCEIFGFFQVKFVEALKRWGIEPQESVEQLKQERSSFDVHMKKAVIDYCLTECRHTVELCDSLASALGSVGLSLTTWIGAGAIAQALLSREGVESHLAQDSDSPCPEQILSAYYGGHVELYQQGIYPHLWNYDISSAYPSEILSLPSLTDATWTKTTTYDPSTKFALWHCCWSISESEPVMPFPFRHKGQIYYPRIGEGWYHASEVRAAKALVDGIEVIEGWILQSPTTVPPFAFVEQLYKERRKLKQRGHAGEKVLKLGLNSLYGKLAQGVGYQGKVPRFQSFLWAGMITAGTRARVLELAALNKDALVMVATDGLFFTSPLNVETDTGTLGCLESQELGETFIGQPGIYYTHPKAGVPYGKSRGFFTREIDFPDLQRGYQESGPYYIAHFSSTRFFGLGQVMVTGDLSRWRTWPTTNRKLSLYPSRKFIKPEEAMQPVVRHLPPKRVSDTISEPYVVKRSQGEMTSEELEKYMNFIAGNEQPMRG